MSQFSRYSPEDRAAFLAAVDGARPLRQPDRVSLDGPKPSPRPRQREIDEAAVLAELLHGSLAIDDWLDLGGADSFLRCGVPRSVLRDLRRGRWSIQDHIDLHGLNRQQAHAEVARFVAEALRVPASVACASCMGAATARRGREAILRQLVKAWLGRHRDVLAFCHAPPNDGGDGALWVLLKSSAAVRRAARWRSAAAAHAPAQSFAQPAAYGGVAACGGNPAFALTDPSDPSRVRSRLASWTARETSSRLGAV
ncbi:MAG: Smr/MutS family protein [Candidatus Accumulibacter necessarius]|jgi:DNA-nicking Smr family endonuclease|uniref:Smr/MutS family protein n=1 Tax=Candidatus Accumulibacter necessarius TaxID=2954386 RepID=UPI002FC31275